MLPDVFCHLFQLPGQTFAFVHLLGGLGVSDCICCGCSLPANSSSWLLKTARPMLLHTWNAWATQPSESKLSVSRCRTLKLWPDGWTALCCTPLQYVGVRVHHVHAFIHSLSAIGSAVDFSELLEIRSKNSPDFNNFNSFCLCIVSSTEFCGDLQWPRRAVNCLKLTSLWNSLREVS